MADPQLERMTKLYEEMAAKDPEVKVVWEARKQIVALLGGEEKVVELQESGEDLPALTALLMVQESVFNAYLEAKRGNEHNHCALQLLQIAGACAQEAGQQLQKDLHKFAGGNPIMMALMQVMKKDRQEDREEGFPPFMIPQNGPTEC